MHSRDDSDSALYKSMTDIDNDCLHRAVMSLCFVYSKFVHIFMC